MDNLSKSEDSGGSRQSKKPKLVPPPKPPPRPLLPVGIIIPTNFREYSVGALLGKGGFGSVYKVKALPLPGAKPDEYTNKEYALKIEYNEVKKNPTDRDNMMLRLKIEIAVFEDIQKAKELLPTVDQSHFVNLIDKGCTPDFKFYVMEIVSLTLDKLHKEICQSKTPKEEVLYIATQTLNSIEALHKLGYLHRDIKPANFAIGLPPKEATIYILDFGICRKFRKPDGRQRKARTYCPFLGTLKYSSILALEMKDQSMKDDLEMWIYMVMEYFFEGNLTWFTDRKARCNYQDILRLKQDLMKNYISLYNDGNLRVPKRFLEVITMQRGYGYESVPEYDKIREILKGIETDEECTLKRAIYWVGRIDPTQRKKKPRRMITAIDKKDEKKSEPGPKKDEKKVLSEPLSSNNTDKIKEEKRKKLDEAIMKAFADYGEPRTREQIKKGVDRIIDLEPSSENVESCISRTKKKNNAKKKRVTGFSAEKIAKGNISPLPADDKIKGSQK